MIFYVYFIFSLFSSWFFHRKFINIAELLFFVVFFFFGGGGEGMPNRNRDEKWEERGFKRQYFWMQKKKVLEMTYLCEFKITYLLCSLQKMLNNFVTVGSSIIEAVKLLNLSVSWNNLSRDKVNNKIKFTIFS